MDPPDARPRGAARRVRDVSRRVPLPDDLASRSHFFWTSGEIFRRAVDRWPSIPTGWHASRPGPHAQRHRGTIGATERIGIWLDRESWERRRMPLSTAAAPTARWSRLRLRSSAHLRDLCAETTFTSRSSCSRSSSSKGWPAASRFPGSATTARLGVAAALDAIAADVDAGVRHFLLFAVPSRSRSSLGYGAFAAPWSTRSSARSATTLHLWVDICLCSSTDDGHCAISTGEARSISMRRSARSQQMTVRVGRCRRRRRQPKRHDGRPDGAAARRRSTAAGTAACRS